MRVPVIVAAIKRVTATLSPSPARYLSENQKAQATCRAWPSFNRTRKKQRKEEETTRSARASDGWQKITGSPGGWRAGIPLRRTSKLCNLCRQTTAESDEPAQLSAKKKTSCYRKALFASPRKGVTLP